jgi:hypothetical protein
MKVQIEIQSFFISSSVVTVVQQFVGEGEALSGRMVVSAEEYLEGGRSLLFQLQMWHQQVRPRHHRLFNTIHQDRRLQQ